MVSIVSEYKVSINFSLLHESHMQPPEPLLSLQYSCLSRSVDRVCKYKQFFYLFKEIVIVDF